MAKFRKSGVVLVVIGTVAYSLSQWAQLVVLVRFASVETVGYFALALAISAPAFMFSNLRLRFLLATSADGHERFRAYRLLRVGTALLSGGVVVVIGAVVQVPLSVVVLMALLKATEAISDIHQGLFQQREEFARFAQSQLAAAVVLLAGCYLGISLTGRLESALLGMLIGRVAVLLLIDSNLSRRLYPAQADMPHENSRLEEMRLLVVAGLPLGLVALLVSLNANIPRYFVEGYLSTVDLGYFAAIVYIPAAGYLLAGTLGQVAMPRMARAVANRDRSALMTILTRLCLFGASLGGAGILLASSMGGTILNLLYGEEFSGLGRLLTVVMMAAAISYVVVQIVYILTALRALRGQIGIYLSDALLLSVFCAILVPRFDLVGAGYAMILSQSVQLIVAAGLLQWAIRRVAVERSSE